MRNTLYVLIGWQLWGLGGFYILVFMLIKQLKQRIGHGVRKPAFASRVWRQQRIKRI
jgi:hypothetical protein